MNNIPTLFTLISLSAVFTIIADVLGKQWTISHKISYFVWAIILIIISGILFIFALKFEKLGLVSLAWDGITSIFLIAAGYFIFKENFSIIQIAGTGLIFLGIIMLSIKIN